MGVIIDNIQKPNIVITWCNEETLLQHVQSKGTLSSGAM